MLIFILMISGEKSIKELEERFNPKDIKDDGDLNIFSQK